MTEYRQTADEVCSALRTDPIRGLTSADARSRLAQGGPNELTAEQPVPAWKRFLGQFENALVLLLLAAIAISAVLWVYERDSDLPYEAIAISAIVLLNACMGYVQESRAESAAAALRSVSAARARVVRDGEERGVAAADVVPGDLVVVEAGDTVAADARVLDSAALQLSEAALTGESVPVPKDPRAIEEEVSLAERHNMLYGGTSVVLGRGTAVVVATGMRTEMGRIAGLLTQLPTEKTPLQKELDRVGKTLGTAVIVLAVVMIATILVAQHVRRLSAFLDVLVLGVALAVAAVPEGLPALVTACLAIGVQRMARRNAIVRRLSAVETLGSASVIASDKTGTLTKNEMTVREVVTASGRVVLSGIGYEPRGEVREKNGGPLEGALRVELDRTLAVAGCASNAMLRQKEGRWTIHGDPTEGALIVAAQKAGLDAQRLAQRFARIGELPFSPERKMMSTVHSDAESDGRTLIFTKGAPDVLLTRCSHELVGEEHRALSEVRRRQILDENDALAGRALRTLAVAFQTQSHAQPSPDDSDQLERDLVFAGLIGMIDPPREEAAGAVDQARRAGIRPIMITGDHPKTASVIAAELGVAADGRTVTGIDLQRMTPESLDETVKKVSVYARVNPEHKLLIVQALQRHGAVVAMTGDGVNDAPALKTADIGVAMGRIGTDVSRKAADIVLADDNFATIVAAIEEGRAIFSNIRKFLRYLLSSNIGEVMTMFFGVLLAGAIGLNPGGETLALPLLATHLLWINLVTDGAPALALGFDPMSPAVMRNPPRAAGEGVITGQMWINAFWIGAVMAVGTLYVLDSALPGGFVNGSGTLKHGQTMAFTTLVLFQLFNVLNARSDRESAFRQLLASRWLLAAIALSLALQWLVVAAPFLQRSFSTTPLTMSDWLRCTAVASSVLWLREIEKAVRRVTGGR
jgi:Ca2+-transporting ATPase